MVTPCCSIARPADSARSWISVGVMVLPISRAQGRDPTRLAIRCTPPPSSSVITRGEIPPAAPASRLASSEPRSAGAELPNKSSPPTPWETSAATALRSVSGTGIATTCSASRSTGQVASTIWVEQSGVLGDGGGAGLGDGASAGP